MQKYMDRRFVGISVKAYKMWEVFSVQITGEFKEVDKECRSGIDIVITGVINQSTNRLGQFQKSISEQLDGMVQKLW